MSDIMVLAMCDTEGYLTGDAIAIDADHVFSELLIKLKGRGIEHLVITTLAELEVMKATQELTETKQVH